GFGRSAARRFGVTMSKKGTVTGWLQSAQAVALVGLAVCAAYTVGVLLAIFPPPFTLQELKPDLGVACGVEQRRGIEGVSLYAVQARWTALFVLMTALAAAGVAAAVCTSAATVLDPPAGQRRAVAWSTVGVAVVGVGAMAVHLYLTRHFGPRLAGFLTHLLDTLRNDRSCDWVSTRVLTARQVGESAAILGGAAMGATAAPVSDPGEVANRIQRLQLLLYCGSLLFVAGILMSESNFSLIIAQLVGDAGDDKMSKGLADVIKSGTVQAGVGYSAVL